MRLKWLYEALTAVYELLSVPVQPVWSNGGVLVLRWGLGGLVGRSLHGLLYGAGAFNCDD